MAKTQLSCLRYSLGIRQVNRKQDKQIQFRIKKLLKKKKIYIYIFF